MPMRDSAYGGERQDWRSTLARSGLVAKGVLYGALGVLAMDVASGEASSNTASRQGAIELVASQPFGQWLLGILTFGLFALATWQVILAFTGDPVEGDDLKDRLKFAGKAVIYGATAVTALTFLTGNGSGGGGNASEQQATATIMSWPGGAWIVGAIGAIALFAAFQQVYAHGIHKKFMRRLDRGRMHGDLERGIERAGQAGYASRGLVALLVGIFLLVAAVQHDPQEVVGLSGALAKLAAQSWGAAALWFVAVGLLLYGGFCFAEARYRRAT